MAANTPTRLRDLLVSFLLGVLSCALLGYLIGLRILTMNPELAADWRNILFLLLSTTFLYALVGTAVGLGIFFLLQISGRFSGHDLRGKLLVILTVLIWAVVGLALAFVIMRFFPAFAHRSYLLLLLGDLYLLLGTLLLLIFPASGSRTTGRALLKPWLAIFLVATCLLFAYLIATRQHLRSGNFDNLTLIVYFLSALFLSRWLYRSACTRPDPLSGRSRFFTLPKFFIVFGLYLIFALGFALLDASRSPALTEPGDPQEIQAALAAPADSARVAIIGWDGAEWSVIDSLIAQGKMPNFKRLMEGGVRAPFKSLEELKSPLIWASIATGKTPEKHGIEDFGSFQFAGMPNNFTDYPDGIFLYRLITLFQPQADLPITSSVRRCQALWNLLSDARRSVGVVGWWASWPAEILNDSSFVLSDRFTYTLFNPRASVKELKEGQTYPPELLSEVEGFCRLPDSITEEEIGRFLPHTGQFASPAAWSQAQYADWNPMYQFKLSYTASESFQKAGLYLYEKYHPEFYGCYFEGIDMISHFFWQYYRPEEFTAVPDSDVLRFGQVIPEFYGYMDEILGQYLDQLEPGTDVMVLSDHGFGPDTNPRIPFRSGDHRPYGVFLASGPHFRQGVVLNSTNVLDITPTVLYLFGLPAAADMDGRVLEEAINPSFLSAHPPQEIKSYETDHRASTIVRSSADEQVKDQIKALGYTQ